MVLFAFEGDEFFFIDESTLSGVLDGLGGGETGFGFHY